MGRVSDQYESNKMAKQFKKVDTTMHEIIKRHYVLINDKRGFCDKLGKVLNMNGSSVYSHYFGTYLGIPEKKMEITLRELKKELRKQSRDIDRALKLELTK